MAVVVVAAFTTVVVEPLPAVSKMDRVETAREAIVADENNMDRREEKEDDDEDAADVVVVDVVAVLFTSDLV